MLSPFKCNYKFYLFCFACSVFRRTVCRSIRCTLSK